MVFSLAGSVIYSWSWARKVYTLRTNGRQRASGQCSGGFWEAAPFASRIPGDLNTNHILILILLHNQ